MSVRGLSVTFDTTSSSRKVKKPASHFHLRLPSNEESQRTHDEITRSESRSVTPGPVHKRRRTQRSPSYPSSQTEVPPHYHRDGFDYRRPIMSLNNRPQDLIDLTAEDEDEEVQDLTARRGVRREDSFDDMLDDEIDEAIFFEPSDINDGGWAPPGPSPLGRQPAREVIDISSEDEGEVARPVNHTRIPPARLRSDSTSSDIVILSEQPAAPTRPAAPSGNRSRRQSVRSRRPTPGPNGHRELPPVDDIPPMPPMRPYLGGVVNFIRNGAQNLRATIVDQFPPYAGRYPPANHVLPGNDLQNIAGVIDADDEFQIMPFDYGAAPFRLRDGESEAPQATPGAAYKAPPEVPKGFAGNVDENGVYTCPRCDEELATGSEEKQQIWVVKQCGHVSFPLRFVCYYCMR